MSFAVSKRALFTSAATASAAGAYYYIYSPSRYAATPTKMLPAYEATFSVALECDECVKDVSSALEKLPGKLNPVPHPAPSVFYLTLRRHAD